MALIERFFSDSERKIPVHQFMAAMQELARGKMTRADVEVMFVMDDADKVDLSSLITRYQTKTTNLDKFAFAHALHDILLLAEAGLRYTTAADARTRILAI